MPFVINSPREYGLVASLSFVVGTVVGTGIYLKPALVARLAPEPWQNLSLWLLGGFFALCGAVVYAKLAEIWPASGGAFIYVKHCYGDWAASLLLTADILLARPAAVGALATGLGLVWELSLLRTFALAAAVILVLAAVQLVGRRAVGGIQIVLTALKTLPLLLIALAGLAQSSSSLPEPVAASSPQWAAGFLAVIWAYDGWYNLTVLAGEVQKPRSTIYSSLVGGVGVIIVAYLGLNLLMLQKVDRSSIVSMGIPFLALLEGTSFAFLAGAIKLCLSISILATLNGVLACGPSMISAGGLDGASDLNSTGKATLMFSGWCLLLLAIFSALPSQFALFDRLSEYTAFVVSGLSGLTVSCIFILPRFGHQNGWLSRLCAIVFLLIDLGLMLLLIVERPVFAGVGVVSVLASSVFLTWLKRYI